MSMKAYIGFPDRLGCQGEYLQRERLQYDVFLDYSRF